MDNVRAYLIRSLHNELISEKRGQIAKAAKHCQIALDADLEELPYEEQLIRLQQDEALRLHIREAFAELSPRQRQLLQMRYFDNLDYTEIAQECNISKRTAYNIVQKGLLTLKKHFLIIQSQDPLLTTDLLLTLLPLLILSEAINH